MLSAACAGLGPLGGRRCRSARARAVVEHPINSRAHTTHTHTPHTTHTHVHIHTHKRAHARTHTHTAAAAWLSAHQVCVVQGSRLAVVCAPEPQRTVAQPQVVVSTRAPSTGHAWRCTGPAQNLERHCLQYCAVATRLAAGRVQRARASTRAQPAAGTRVRRAQPTGGLAWRAVGLRPLQPSAPDRFSSRNSTKFGRVTKDGSEWVSSLAHRARGVER